MQIKKSKNNSYTLGCKPLVLVLSFDTTAWLIWACEGFIMVRVELQSTEESAVMLSESRPPLVPLTLIRRALMWRSDWHTCWADALDLITYQFERNPWCVLLETMMPLIFQRSLILFCRRTCWPHTNSSGCLWDFVASTCLACELSQAAFMLSTFLGGWKMDARPRTLRVRCRKSSAVDLEPLVLWL